MSDPTLYDELGGEPALRRVVDRFVDKMFDDVMIGYLFRAVSRGRVKEKEFEHAAEHLGAGIRYTGKALDAAHKKHAIRGGQFMRRLKILENTLDELGVPKRVKEHWLAHTLELRPLITADEGGVCAD
ncbi:MAG TPA: group 1 truncated hemoglobin [Polyangiaceae bacterium]